MGRWTFQPASSPFSMVSESPDYVGVDGTPDGWIAVRYGDDGFIDVNRFPDMDALWRENSSADNVLVDIPIGMREASAEPRNCDAAARECLSPDRHSSVFPVPIRPAVEKESYEDAKQKQEEKTDGSLGVQSHAISPKIRELDDFSANTRGRRESFASPTRRPVSLHSREIRCSFRKRVSQRRRSGSVLRR